MNVFISSPISSLSFTEYKKLAKNMLLFINRLQPYCNVYSEIGIINSIEDYDQPYDSIIMDFDRIKNSDYFIMYYPKKLATSSLIELGYALAFEIPVIIVTPSTQNLPYLVHGIHAINSESTIIEAESFDESTIEKIIDLIVR